MTNLVQSLLDTGHFAPVAALSLAAAFVAGVVFMAWLFRRCA